MKTLATAMVVGIVKASLYLIKIDVLIQKSIRLTKMIGYASSHFPSNPKGSTEMRPYQSRKFVLCLIKSLASMPVLAVLVWAMFAAKPMVAQEAKATTEKWIQLFNGKDLEGWTPKIRYHDLGDNFANTFRVENGVLKVGYEGYDEFKETFGHLFYKDSFSHYRIRVEYRFVGNQVKGGPGWALRNSGIMIHGERPETITKDQDFPASIEVQLLGGDGQNPRSTANLCTPGTNVVMNDKLILAHCTNSKSKTFHGEGWVAAEVEVKGNEVIRHYINGELVLEYNKPQLDDRDAHAKELMQKAGDKMLSSGSISLQSESHPVEFRKVELLDLSSK